MIKRKKYLVLVLMTVLLNFFSGCMRDEALPEPEPVNVSASFRLESSSSMGGKITIHEVYLKLDHIEAGGTVQGKNVPGASHAVSADEPPYQLSKADSGQVNFTLPFRTYDRMDFHLFLFQDNYELLLNEIPVEESPDPPGNDDGTNPDTGDETTGGDDPAGEPEQGNDDDDGKSDAGHDDKDEDDDDGDDGDGDDDGSDGNDSDNGDDDDKNQPGDKEDNDHKKKDKKNDRDQKDDDKKDKDKDRKEKNKDGNKDDKNDRDDDDDRDDGRISTAKINATVDLDHFFQNAKPAVVMVATYANNEVTLDVILAVTGIERVIVPAKQNDAFTISLAENNLADISFDPGSWFASLSPADIESASIQNYRGQPVLFIHPDFNNHLFEPIISRLQESAILNFTTQMFP